MERSGEEESLAVCLQRPGRALRKIPDLLYTGQEEEASSGPSHAL